MHRTRAAMLRARWVVSIAVGRCVGQMAFRRKMRNVLDDFTHSGSETPEEQDGDHHRTGTFHRAEI